jgi:hypothetical protein
MCIKKRRERDNTPDEEEISAEEKARVEKELKQMEEGTFELAPGNFRWRFRVEDRDWVFTPALSPKRRGRNRAPVGGHNRRRIQPQQKEERRISKTKN